MTLPRHIYQMLESIVGPQYISDAPHIMAGYRRPGPHAPLSPSPEAVLLPATTEEIQAIVKVCNRFDLAYRVKSDVQPAGWVISIGRGVTFSNNPRPQ